MNTFQSTLYADLLHLSVTTESFYFSEHTLDSKMYRIFNYRLATYSMFQLPNALECRGAMFEVDSEGNAIRLASLPQPKFFNLNENPFTMGLNLSDDNIERIEMKEDGSLISTFMFGDEQLGIKSKGSTDSIQVHMTLDILSRDDELRKELLVLAKMGYTTNMELTSPKNRIILNYADDRLVVLNIRDTNTGEFINKSELSEVTFPRVTASWVENALSVYDMPASKLVAAIPEFCDIEGVIVYLKTGEVFKSKCHWYVIQHQAKDDIDTPRRLYEAAIKDITDDLRGLFTDNPAVLQEIDRMDAFAALISNKVKFDVTDFIKNQMHLVGSRKEYAIAAKDLLPTRTFGLAMQAYQYLDRGEEPQLDYVTHCIKLWKTCNLESQYNQFTI